MTPTSDAVSTRTFNITPSQYQLFRFSVPRRTSIRVRLVASSPVNLMLMDNDDRQQYENGELDSHTYTASWGRRSDLETAVTLDAGTWYLIVEGNMDSSRGRIDISTVDLDD